MKEGILVERINAQPEVRRMAESATDWEYRGEAEDLYRMAVLFKDRLLDGVIRIDRGRLPDPVISFESLNIKTLAGYTVHRNPQGLLDEITFNTQHYTLIDGQRKWRHGEWAKYETLLHEQIHLWQQNFGEHPYKSGRNTHNAEFVAKCEAFGLHPLPVKGYHITPADGVFADLMKELGIERPQVETPPSAPTKKDWFRLAPEQGRSTLLKFTCECGQNIRVSRKDWPGAICKACGTEYVMSDKTR